MTMDLERGTVRQWVIGRDGVKRWADTSESVEQQPRCAVGGVLKHGHVAMCGDVVVGGKLCGRKGECPHKVPNEI